MAEEKWIYTKEQADSLTNKLHKLYESLPDEEKILLSEMLDRAAGRSETSGFATLGKAISLAPSAFQSRLTRIDRTRIRNAVPITW